MGKKLITAILSVTLVLTALTACKASSGPGLALGLTDSRNQAGSQRPVNVETVADELAKLAPPEDIPPEAFSALKLQFLQALKDEAERKQASAFSPIEEARRVTDLTMEILPDGSGTKLQWHYRNDGDYDQNGVVSISDIVPLARLQGADASDPNSAAGVCDGNRDRRVSVADVMAIARFYSAEVAGYEIRRGTSEFAGYFDNYYDPVASIGLSQGDGANEGRRAFELPLGYVDHWFRVNPVDGRLEAGPLSDCAVSMQTFSISGTVRDPGMSAMAGVEVQLDGAETCYTDGEGKFRFSEVGIGEHTVTPSLSGFLFFPSERVVEITARDIEFCTFDAAPGVEGYWTSHQLLDDGYITDMAVIDGRPAVVVSLWLGCAYMIADDSTAVSWSEPRFLFDDNRTVLDLCEVDRRPALLLRMSGNDDIYYSLADSPEGHAWSEVVRVAAADDIGGWSFAVVGDRPALTYFDNDDGELKYACASTELGTEYWTSPVVITDQTDDRGSFYLADIGGTPAVVFVDVEGYCVSYTEESEISGSWSEPFVIGRLSYRYGSRVVLTEVSGHPYVVYSDYLKSKTYCTSRPDEQTGEWSEPALVNRWYSMSAVSLCSSGERVVALGHCSGYIFLASLESGYWRYALLEYAQGVYVLALNVDSLYITHRGESWSPYYNSPREVGVFSMLP